MLKKIQEYAEPVIVLGWKDNELENELTDEGYAIYYLPEKKVGKKYLRNLMQLTTYHLGAIKSPTTEIDQRRNSYLASGKYRIRRRIRDTIYKFLSFIPGYIRFVKNNQRKLLWSDTNFSEFKEIVDHAKPDLVFCLTPYFIEEEFLLRAAQDKGIPLSTAILSFDNLTTRGYIPVQFSNYYLWNVHNVEELMRI
ncbi:MAG: hypothetical protein AAGU75_21960, partial [Bacillota bacterium]